MRPILVDLKQRMKRKKVLGFKIAVSGRFQREARATYWWRKEGKLLIAGPVTGVDYSASLHRTKYGVCAIKIWLISGLRNLNEFKFQYPIFYPFYFMLKKDKISYFILKKNELFYKNILKTEKALKYLYIKYVIKPLI